MEPERMIADLEARANDLARRSEEMQQQIQQTSATLRSPDGAVTVTVAPNGSLQHIEFSPRVGDFSHVQLGQVVMTTVRRAQAQAASQVAAIVEPEFGGTEAMDFLTSFIPQVEEEPPPTPAEDGSVLRDTGWGAPPPRPARPAARPAAPDDDDFGGSVLR
ncbi:YbaB/EbfC family nucleoid-associated protein [Saccharothrix variisporea]|uniref:YbaB/EbfC DNA-binding family protein n=1 Tax=Saccharothrix variisporea TaxID=543527 RepID=A0A495XDB7_9PSEU|nr:YbaB/EbfC family nucleoid-associated protein [Saccharothrix variisporea]RKT72471.1 YbaB/EbfC DNA-binding family protein [Saccharothrix variisporea]